MKTVILAVSIVWLIFASNVFAVLSGDGTQANPYLIQSRADFDEFANPANSTIYWASGVYTKLMCDPNLSDTTYTQAVIAPDMNSTTSGFQGPQFTGVFDGNGHTISSLTKAGWTRDYVGLFGYVGSGGQIKNLGVENVNIKGSDYVGGLVGYSSGTLTACYATGIVSGDYYVGGLLGENSGTLTGCYATGGARGDGPTPECVGGLVGRNYGSLTACYASGSVNGGSYVSGLVGYNSGTLTDCYATGEVGGQASFVGPNGGGLVGYNSGTLTACYATGAVNGSRGVGGLMAYNSGSLTNCYASGAVRGSTNVGGLVGKNDHGSLTSCSATGSVYSDGMYGGDDVGGLVGENDYGSITACHATGLVIAYGYEVKRGGLVGSNGGTITACYATGSTRGNNTVGYVGGLVGYNSGTLTACYATHGARALNDPVEWTSKSARVGGLVGQNAGILTACYATGVAAGDWDYVGGLVGYNAGSLTTCYATGAVSGANDVGGLVGKNYQGKIIQCYSTGKPTGILNVGGLCGDKDTGGNYEDTGNFWDTQTSQMETSAMGTGRTTLLMKQQATFTATPYLWDFLGETDNGTNDYWRMCVDNLDYPKLSWQYIQHGDFACPDGVSFDDFQRLCEDWLLTYATGLYGADASGDKTVNFVDFAIFAKNSLWAGGETNPVGYWQFNEGSGTIALDSSGYGNTGQLVNGPVWADANGLSFDGVDDYVEVPASASLNSIEREFTVCVWAYLSAYSSEFPKLVVKPYESFDDPWELYSIDLGHFGRTPRFIISDGVPGGDLAIVVDNNSLSLNRWYYIAGTYDGNIAKLYVNGEPVASAQSNLQIGNNSMPIGIGGRLGVNSFPGLLDEVRIYNRALSEAQTLELYNRELPTHLP